MLNPVRKDFDATKLRAVAGRLLALASIYDGAKRGEAAKISGVTLQIRGGLGNLNSRDKWDFCSKAA